LTQAWAPGGRTILAQADGSSGPELLWVISSSTVTVCPLDKRVTTSLLSLAWPRTLTWSASTTAGPGVSGTVRNSAAASFFFTAGAFFLGADFFFLAAGALVAGTEGAAASRLVVVIGAAVLMLVGLNYIVNATKIGKAIRSVAQDRTTAALMGVSVNAIISFTFLLGGALGGAAGLLYALKFTRIDPYVGFIPGIKAFTAAVLGGIGNLTGALLGGIVLGMLESFAGAYLGTFTRGAFGSEYKDIIAFLVLIIFIIFRPSGLLGEQVSQKA